ncbi:MAG: anti-sigma factor [Candidatus Methylomirabilales bacterium]
MAISRLTCKQVILDYLGDYLDAALGPATLRDFEAHLADCPACRAYLRTYRATAQLSRAAGPPPMPEELQARLRAFLLARLGNR